MFGGERLGVEDIYKESMNSPEAPLEQDYSTYQKGKVGREDTGNLGPHINTNIGGQISLINGIEGYDIPSSCRGKSNIVG